MNYPCNLARYAFQPPLEQLKTTGEGPWGGGSTEWSCHTSAVYG